MKPKVTGSEARFARTWPDDGGDAAEAAEGAAFELKLGAAKKKIHAQSLALKLGIVDGTVKLHVRSILRKLGIRSRVEAAILAIEEGLARRER